MRSPISAEEKLAITLRYLATGESLNSLKYQFRVHKTTIGKFIICVCEAICNVLAPDYMKCPSTKEEWKYIIDQPVTDGNFLIVMLQLMKNTLAYIVQKIVAHNFTATKHF